MRAHAIHAIARAIALAEADRPREAAAAAEDAVARAPDDPALRLSAAYVAFAIGAYAAAMDHAERAQRLAPDAVAAAEAVFFLRHRLGRTREALPVAARVLALDGTRIPVVSALAEIFEHRGAFDEALPVLEALRREGASTATLRLREASILEHLGRRDEAVRAIAEAGELSARGHLRAAEIAIRAGGFECAEAHAKASIQADPSAIEARLAIAELRLWRGELDAARAMAGEALAIAPGAAAAIRVHGAIAIREGRFEEGLTHLDRALAIAPDDAEANTLRGEALLRLGRFEAAYEAIDRAVTAAGGLYFAARALRLLGTILAGEQPRAMTPWSIAPLVDGLAALVPERASMLARDANEPSDIASLIEQALDRLGGNRSPIATKADDRGRLTLVPIPPDARAASRSVLGLIECLPADEVLRRFDRVIADHARSSLPIAHRGELFLWLGRYAEARRDLEAALAQHTFTRWPYIGLTLIACLEGNPREALRYSERGVETMRSTGTSVYVHRGEAHRRLGDLDAAERDLVRAIELHPTRLAAYVNLALVHAARGDRERTGALFAEVFDRAAGLLSDAAIAIGAPPPVPFEPVPFDAQAALLDEALAMMKGNRASSLVTYVTRDGHLRIAPSPRIFSWRERDLKAARSYLRAVKRG